LTENSAGLGTVTRKLARERAVELAVINGRSAQETDKSDWEPAKLELTGHANPDPNAAALESALESKRWNPLPGSTGHKAPVAPGDDEDEDGRSDNLRLLEAGIADAEHDQKRQANPE
jgi:hypothetical protein